MKTIAHRGCWSSPADANSISALTRALEAGLSVETDIRLSNGEIVLSHDPLQRGKKAPRLTELLNAASLHTGPCLFLNVKEDGLLPHLERLCPWNTHRVVFFDMSVPELIKYTRVVPATNLATRWSDVEEEPVLYERCQWLWIDCFETSIDFANPQTHRKLLERKAVFVSPELHGRPAEAYFEKLASLEVQLGREFLYCKDIALDTPLILERSSIGTRDHL